MENKTIESKDCPFCGQKDCITKSPSVTKTLTRPGPEKNYGKSRIVHIGGEWDYSHADKCPKLINAFKKQDLLEYHVTGIPRIQDSKNALEYKLALHEIHYTIESRNILTMNECEWNVEIFIKRSGINNDRILITRALTPQEAFEKIRCRILCGEVWELDKERFQFLPTLLHENNIHWVWHIHLKKYES